MSFSASAKRARDPQQPLGTRATCLNDCLDRFNLFGYTATRERLRARVGATGHGWTAQQIIDAVALLEQARESWVAFNWAEGERHKALKRQGQRSAGTNQEMSHLAWLQAYLRDGPDRIWQTQDLGLCHICGHPQIHHDYRSCRGCRWNGVARGEHCTTPIPSLSINAMAATRQ